MEVERSKETTLERADFTHQLLMCVNEEKQRAMPIIFVLSSFLLEELGGVELETIE